MAHPVSRHPSTSPPLRHATRLLAMIPELHKAGYQRLRFCSGMAPSGVHWRCLLTHADNIGPDGRTPIDWDTDTAHYTTGSGDGYFDWNDAPRLSARELAVRFVTRFPAIATKADGADWRYAGWLTAILGKAERGGVDALPVFYADYPLTFPPDALPPSPGE